MRKIETQMNAAIQSNTNWASGNTQVVTNMGVSTVYLHGNKIAMIDDTSLTLFDGGWKSNTTKSRLNALCEEFCIAGEGVFQKNYNWFVRKFVGAINGKNVFKTEDFKGGYIFAWYNLTNNRPNPHPLMIIKVSRSTRKQNIMETFISFPETTSFQTAYRLLGNRSNGINIKRATISQVEPNQVTKYIKYYDFATHQVVR